MRTFASLVYASMIALIWLRGLRVVVEPSGRRRDRGVFHRVRGW